jgi:hypothetical protein
LIGVLKSMVTSPVRDGEPTERYLVVSFGGAAYSLLTEPVTNGVTLLGEKVKVAMPLETGDKLALSKSIWWTPAFDVQSPAGSHAVPPKSKVTVAAEAVMLAAASNIVVTKVD